ncbi:LysE family translocator [Pseudoduganella plicata]|uniref:LysE family translocator n=1 Tax=Pseudoduganella plicata TaxID=321984 RepID=A0A4P7BBM3_9BURK|nr:LysE family translocator [Pseudoduganella plicata]QBQ35473.1 LysE family translocator [Pseudoduganella plicata]GGZ02052.1 lysine transporter LysE [Pseudoduganella plicata]
MTTASLYLSMAAFALASSITPGPVNIVALSAGARHGLAASMRHVGGATVGFTLLLLLTGLGLYEVMLRWPQTIVAIRWAGIGFLCYLAWKLAIDDGRLSFDAAAGPSWLSGAAMQWFNPKAWLASVAGMGAYVADGDPVLVWRFAAIYFVVCYLSIACWAYAGAMLRGYLSDAARIRRFNRAMALLLAGSALWLLAR